MTRSDEERYAEIQEKVARAMSAACGIDPDMQRNPTEYKKDEDVFIPAWHC